MPTAEPLQVPPPPSVDIVMASSASTAGQQAAADAEGTQPTNDSGTSANEHIQSYTPDQKKIEVLRIKSWPAFAHYEFLEITPEATRTEIETAYHQKALLTHTDRNSDRDAKEAFQRVNNAREILTDSERRTAYNTERAQRVARGELVQNNLGEEYAENAYDEDREDSDSDIDEDDEPQPMSEAKERILHAMGPLVKKILESGDKRAYKDLDRLDKDMRELNRKENEDRRDQQARPVPIEDHTPPLVPLKRLGEQRRKQLEILNNPAQDAKAKEDARDEHRREQQKFRGTLENLGLPLNWALDLADTTAPSAASQRSGAGNRQTGNAQTAAGRSADQSSSDAMDTSYPWTAGQTKKGKKILAYSPRMATGRSLTTGQPGQICISTTFVVQVEEANPIKILNEFEVGYEAAEAYIGLPKDQKCNITGIQKQYTRMDGFANIIIKGVAHNPYEITYQKLPTGVLLIEYNGENRVINRQALRNAKGTKHADYLIDNFLESVHVDPKTLKKGLALEQANNSMLLEQHRSREPNDAHVRNRNSRRGRLGGQRDVAFNTPREPHQQTSTPLQESAPVRTAPPVQLPSRTSTTDTPSGTVLEEQRQTGAAVSSQFITHDQLGARFEEITQSQNQAQRQLDARLDRLQQMIEALTLQRA